jgi:hypothetical protein
MAMAGRMLLALDRERKRVNCDLRGPRHVSVNWVFLSSIISQSHRLIPFLATLRSTNEAVRLADNSLKKSKIQHTRHRVPRIMNLPSTISSIPHHYPQHTITNWSATFHHKPAVILSPTSITELQQIIRWCKEEKRQFKVIGSGHSPSDINCVNERGVWVSLEGVYDDGLIEVGEIIAIQTKTKSSCLVESSLIWLMAFLFLITIHYYEICHVLAT